ncbi:MAG: metallophosphoesterase family protein, partial [Candidatus Hecatellaceae archaeon]
ELVEAIRRFKPRLSVCGHIHEARGTDRLNGTVICNPGPAARGFYAEVEVGSQIIVELKKFEI